MFKTTFNVATAIRLRRILGSSQEQQPSESELFPFIHEQGRRDSLPCPFISIKYAETATFPAGMARLKKKKTVIQVKRR